MTRLEKITPEASLKSVVKDYLKLKKVWWWNNIQGPLSYKGIPDITVVYKGQVWFLEVKTKKGKLLPDQLRFFTLAADNGLDCAVIRSLEDIQAIIT